MKSFLKNAWSALAGFFADVRQAFNLRDSIVPFLQQHFFYLIWIFFVPGLLYFMAQGRELFGGMFDDNTFVAGFRGASVIFIYFLTALTVLMVPWPFFPKKAYDDWERVRIFTWKKPGTTYVMGILPGILFYVVMTLAFLPDMDTPVRGVLIATVLLIGMLVIAWWFWRKWRPGFWATLAMLFANMALCWLLITRILPSMFDGVDTAYLNYYTVGGLLGVQMALLAGLARIVDRDLRAGRQRYKWLYLFVFSFVVGYVVVLAFCPNLEGVSPIYMLLLLSTFYLMVTSLIITFYRYVIRNGPGKRGWKTAVFWSVLLLGPLAMWILRPPIHTINTISATMRLEDRLDFDAWFKVWWDSQNLAADVAPGDEIPIYFVAVQGGGSRAGLWASEILNRLEMASQYRFHRHCLAITSASGGSAGTSAVLAQWRMGQDSASLLNRFTWKSNDPSRFYNDFNDGMFQRNYLSGQFYDIFIKDAFALGRRGHDRNFRHQRDEALGFAAGLRKSMFGLPIREEQDKHYPLRDFHIGHRLRAFWFDGADERLCVNGDYYVPNYPFMSYLSYWYDDQGKPRPGLPLYFPITCNLHSGRSGFSSPLEMERDADIFTDAIDILKAVDAMNGPEKHNTQTLALVTASNLSELFPLVNAFTRIEQSGNYVDGGLFDNLGLGITMEMVRRTDSLIQRLPDSLRARVKIHVICIENNGLEDHHIQPDTELKPQKLGNKAQVYSLLSFPGRTAIDGRTTWYLNKLRQTMRDPKCLHEIVFQHSAEKHAVPLGRWLSIRSVDAVENRAVEREKIIYRDIVRALRN